MTSIVSRYETLLLMSTDVTDDELSMIEKNFDLISSNAKGKVSRFDKWGKYRLAYPVNKSAYGVYVLVRFELFWSVSGLRGSVLAPKAGTCRQHLGRPAPGGD